jgi:hypothetical protein
LPNRYIISMTDIFLDTRRASGILRGSTETPEDQTMSRQPIAHPYARISHPDQRKGGGLERQTAADVETFAKRFGFTLAKTVLVDDGVSAWKGANASPDHALGRFLADARRGLVRPGDCLLLENYDRLSRQDPWAAIGLVSELRGLGIHVGRLDRGKLLRADSTDYGDFFEAAVEFMRGNSESALKSLRNGAAWARKRARAREGQPMTKRLPAWVEAGPPLRLRPEAAATLRRIFTLAAAGYGYSSIVRKLTEDGVATFGPSGQWSRAYVVRILKDRRAVGELQPRRRDGTPDGDPIPGYYPAAVTEDEWLAARAGAAERRRRPGRYDTHCPNPYAGLLKNPIDGSNYFVATRAEGGKRTRMLFNGAGSEGRVPIRSFPFETFDRCFRALLREVSPAEVLGTSEAPDDVAVLAARHAELEGRLAEIEAEMEKGDLAVLAKVARKVEGELRAVSSRLADARHKAAHPLSATWGEARGLLDAIDSAPDPTDARLRLRSALRRIVESAWLLVVPRGRDRVAAVQVYFVGGARRSFLIYHRPAMANAFGRTKGERRAWSLADEKWSIFDLRRKDHARRFETWVGSKGFAEQLAAKG